MADIVFITPNFNGYVREEPVGTLLLATILRNAGIHTKILPFYQIGNVNDFHSFIQSAVESIRESNPRIVSFYTRCDSYHISLKIAQHIRNTLPNIYIVFGGPQSDLVAKHTLQAFHFIDYICCGEGETTIVPFFRSLLAGAPDNTIRGLAYRKDGKIVINPRPELIADLDSLPTIDYTLLDFDKDHLGQTAWEMFPVDVGRGCPFSCTFCSTKMFWGRIYRLKSAERIIEEIKDIHNRFDITVFNFEHDMFTMNREKVIQICKMLKNVGFDIAWRCSARIDCLDNELIDIMVDAGLTEIFIGIESGSPRIQSLIHKNLKLDKVLDRLTYISRKGIRFVTSFIYGFPEETEEDFSQTMDLMFKISKLPNSEVQNHLCTFFPGTELTNLHINQLERSTVFSNITGEYAVQECEDIIFDNPVLFPHFFEYKTNLREKTKYFPRFFDCWLSASSVYEYIADKYYPNNLCKMLYDFSEINHNLLNEQQSHREKLKQDQFLNSFVNDEHYEVLKEVYRYISWKSDAQNGCVEVFNVDLSAFSNNTPISQLQQKLTIVTCKKTEDNRTTFTFYKTH